MPMKTACTMLFFAIVSAAAANGSARADLPGRLDGIQTRLDAVGTKIPRVFAGMEESFQRERATLRLDLARRTLDFARRSLSRGASGDIDYALLAARDAELFLDYFAEEFSCRAKYPLAPGVEFVTLDMRDFGATGDGVTGNTAALRKALAAAKALNGRPCVLKFPAGKFLFDERMELPRNFVHVRTGDPVYMGPDQDTQFSVFGFENLVITGESPEKTKFVWGVYGLRGLSLVNCVNCTLRNVELSWRETPFVQGTILSVDRRNHSCVIRHDSGTLRPTDDRLYEPDRRPQICAQFRQVGDHFHESLVQNPFFDTKKRAVDLGDGTYRLFFDRTLCPLSIDWVHLDVGLKLVVPDRLNNLHAAGSPACSLCNFENVWVRNSREAGIMPAGGWMITAWKCRTFPKEKGLALSTNADSFFNWRGSHLSRCDFNHMNDDGCNSYSRGAFASAVRGDRTLLAVPQAGVRRAGDMVQVYRPTTGECLFTGRIAETRRENGRDVFVFDAPLPAGVRTQETQHAKDMDAEASRRLALGLDKNERSPDLLFLSHGAGVGFLCVSNHIADLRNVGVQMQCPNALVEGNLIERVHTGLQLSSLMQWNEGPAPYNVLYRGNIVRDVNVGFSSGIGTVGRNKATAAPFRAICLEDNRFEDARERALEVRDVADIAFVNNVFLRCRPVSVGNTRAVVSQGNLWDGKPFEVKVEGK